MTGKAELEEQSKQSAIPPLRRALLLVFLVGILGSGADLVLLEHFEEKIQLIPLALLGLAVIVLAWHVIQRGSASLRVFQVLMILFVIAGLTGLVLHYQGSAEFQLEVNPDLNGMELFLKAIHAKAPPALGPGAMINLGLLGLTYVYRHPILGGRAGE